MVFCFYFYFFWKCYEKNKFCFIAKPNKKFQNEQPASNTYSWKVRLPNHWVWVVLNFKIEYFVSILPPWKRTISYCFFFILTFCEENSLTIFRRKILSVIECPICGLNIIPSHALVSKCVQVFFIDFLYLLTWKIFGTERVKVELLAKYQLSTVTYQMAAWIKELFHLHLHLKEYEMK